MVLFKFLCLERLSPSLGNIWPISNSGSAPLANRFRILSSSNQQTKQRPSTTILMSQVLHTETPPSDFETIFGVALEAYKKHTKKDISCHPLSSQLQSCNSPSAILAVLRAQILVFDQSQSANDQLTKWLDPTVNVVYAFSATLGNGVGLVNHTKSRSRSAL